MKVQTNFYFYISDFDTYEDYYTQEYKAKSNFSKEFFEGKDLELYFFKGTAESQDHDAYIYKMSWFMNKRAKSHTDMYYTEEKHTRWGHDWKKKTHVLALNPEFCKHSSTDS